MSKFLSLRYNMLICVAGRYFYNMCSGYFLLFIFTVAGVARAMNRVNIGSAGPGPSAGSGTLIVLCD